MTPTEELLMSVLIARVRLGHKGWTFSTRNRVQIKSLAEQGFVTYKSGITENSLLVWPTDLARNDPEWFSPDYRAPRETALRAAAEAVLDARNVRCDGCLAGTDSHDPTRFCDGRARAHLQRVLEELDK